MEEGCSAKDDDEMMIHSNSKSVSYGVPNFITPAPFATQRDDILQMHWHV
jgi:hypothetical protein